MVMKAECQSDPPLKIQAICTFMQSTPSEAGVRNVRGKSFKFFIIDKVVT